MTGMPGRTALSLALLVATAVAAAAAPLEPSLPGPGRPIGHGAITHAVEPENAIPELILARVRATRATPFGTQHTVLYPSYTWPMEHVHGAGVNIVNYVDEDPSSGIRDYRGGPNTYDTHRGTDIALHDFRAMDRGSRIVAAAPGTVTTAIFGNLRDRNCAAPDNPTLNYIEVANGDGTYTYYYHLRANSMTVNLGETVQRGQILGLAGSSGYSSGPHLHFEAADWLGGPYVARDPWGGPSNPNPGLWANQEPYIGDEPIRFYDGYVTTQTAAGGNLNNVDYCTYFAERMQDPAVFGIHEPYVPVLLGVHARAGDAYRLELRRPNNSLFGSVDYTLPGDIPAGWHYWYWSWNGFVTSADYGAWSAVVMIGAQVVRTIPFQVGANTVYRPRFTPRAGHSFRINGSAQRDTLHHSPLGGPVTYSLLGAPAFITLADSILTVGAASTQATRSLYFQVIATDASARTDTAWYHVVDPSKPQEPASGVEAPAAVALGFAPAFPNPASGPTTLRFAIPRSGHVTLAIHDLAGRRVRVLIDRRFEPTDGATATWDGRDGTNRRAEPGVYFARLTVDGERRVQRIVRLE